MLVAQTKKVAKEKMDEARRELQASIMLKMAGEVVRSVRQFVAFCVQCGIELPDPSKMVSPEEKLGWAGYTYALEAAKAGEGKPAVKLVRARSFTDLREPVKESSTTDTTRPSSSYSNRHSLQPQPRRQGSHSSPAPGAISASASESMTSSNTSRLQGLYTTAQVLGVLHRTHDHYLSTIAALIGHAHTHSRVSHASKTDHMFELLGDIVKMVSNMFMIADAVFVHPDIHRGRLQSMREAQDSIQGVVNAISDSVRMMGIPCAQDSSDDDERHDLLKLATTALKAGAECVSAIKICLTRSVGEKPLVLQVPASNAQINGLYHFHDVSLGPPPSSSTEGPRSVALRGTMEPGGQITSAVPEIVFKRPQKLESSFDLVEDGAFQPTFDVDHRTAPLFSVLEEDTAEAETSFSSSIHPDESDPESLLLGRDFADEDVAYNESGQLLGASLSALVVLLTPHDTLVDAEFSTLFFSTFRMFCPPRRLAELLVQRYNPNPPPVSTDLLETWEQQKLGPVRLRVSNFIRMWAELHWRPEQDDDALEVLLAFVTEDLGRTLPSAAHRNLELLKMRASHDGSIPARTREVSSSSAAIVASETPRPVVSKSLLNHLRAGQLDKVSITDFDAMELARQLTIMECHLYCAISQEEILATGTGNVKSPPTVKAVVSLSTGITSWVAESILNERDIRRRSSLLKFFIKLADVCMFLSRPHIKADFIIVAVYFSQQLQYHEVHISRS
jgi:son of sevenless